MNLDLKNQIALVTGASRGIGQAIAQELAACGATVIGTATTELGAQAIAARLQAHGGTAKVLNVPIMQRVKALLRALSKNLVASTFWSTMRGLLKIIWQCG